LASTLLIAFFALVIVGLTVALFRIRNEHRRKVEALEQRHRDQLDELRRKQARQIDRLRRERDEADKTGHLDFVDDLLPALDALDQALAQTDEESAADEGLLEGVAMTRRQVRTTLERFGVETIDPEPAERFDPEFHEAMRAVETDEVESGGVMRCHRKGYRFEKRVLRAAAVDVAAATEESADDEPTMEDDEARQAPQQEEAAVEETVLGDLPDTDEEQKEGWDEEVDSEVEAVDQEEPVERGD
jgi:molecular chaperone GrpE